MRSALNRRSNRARHAARDRDAARSTASTASSTPSTTNPVTPSSMTSGTEPRRHAITGVPHGIASAITMPNGSGQSIGNSSARAPPSSSRFPASPTSPIISTCDSRSSGSITSS